MRACSPPPCQADAPAEGTEGKDSKSDGMEVDKADKDAPAAQKDSKVTALWKLLQVGEALRAVVETRGGSNVGFRAGRRRFRIEQRRPAHHVYPNLNL